MGRILEDYADDPTFEELKSFLEAQSDDELKELLALTWLGRGDYTVEEWQEALSQVRDVRDKRTVDYLLGTPLLADYSRRASPSSATPARTSRSNGRLPSA